MAGRWYSYLCKHQCNYDDIVSDIQDGGLMPAFYELGGFHLIYKKDMILIISFMWQSQKDLNPQSAGYKPVALTITLCDQVAAVYLYWAAATSRIYNFQIP